MSVRAGRFGSLASIVLLAVAFVGTAADSRATAQDRGLARTQDGTSEGRRMALVVGNDAYHDAPLKNAGNDASAMTTALQDLGFTVTSLTDTGREAFGRAVATFADTLRPDDVAFFYFAGHGVQIAGENYLIPVDTQVGSATSIRINALSSSQVLDALKHARVSVLILDACRNNPYSGSGRDIGGGLAAMQPRGALVAFSTGANEVASDNPSGGNGLFTGELIRTLREPGLTLRDVFFRVRQKVYEQSSGRQFPAVYDGLLGDLTLRAAAAPLNPRPLDRPAPASPAPLPTSSAGSTDPVKPALSFDSNAAIVTILIKPEHAAGFERVMAKLKTALQSGNATRRTQADGWRVYKGLERTQGNVIYVMRVDPVLRGEEYDITKLLTEAFPAEVNELYETYKSGFAGRGISLLNRLQIPGLGGPIQQSSPRSATPGSAAPVLSLDSDAGVLTILIKPDKTADFESVLTLVGAAMSRSSSPVRQTQAAGWRAYRAAAPATGEFAGSAVYVMTLDPVVRGAEYDLTRLISEEFPVEVQEAFQKYKNAFVGRGITPLSLFMDMAR